MYPLVERSCQGGGKEQGLFIAGFARGEVSAGDNFEVVGIRRQGDIGTAVHPRDLAGDVEQRFDRILEIDRSAEERIALQQSVDGVGEGNYFLRGKIPEPA